METEVALKEKPPKTKLPSPEERLELVLLGLIREQTVENLCQQSGVSKALFYQWLRRGREGLLKALEAKKPGRRPLAEKTSPQEILELRARLKRMEQEMASLRKEKDRYKLQTEVAQRVIQRNGWNPEPKPRKSRVKKNGARTMKPESATSASGPSSASSAPRSQASPLSGASAEAPTGGGSADAPQNESRD